MARPTKYTEEVCQAILDFFDIEPFEEEIKVNEKTGNEYKVYKANRLPTVERFAAEQGVSVQTLHNWTKKHPEFLEAFTRARQLQVDMLVQNGLLGHTKEGLTKFLLTNVSDYQEVKHVQQNVRDLTLEDAVASGLSDEELERIAKAGIH